MLTMKHFKFFYGLLDQENEEVEKDEYYIILPLLSQSKK